MTEDETSQNNPRQDWNKLAKQALDLWQHHLTALSQDEKAKASMAELMRPMTQMATQWADMVQSSLQPMHAGNADEPTYESPFTSTDDSSVQAADDVNVTNTTAATSAPKDDLEPASEIGNEPIMDAPEVLDEPAPAVVASPQPVQFAWEQTFLDPALFEKFHPVMAQVKQHVADMQPIKETEAMTQTPSAEEKSNNDLSVHEPQSVSDPALSASSITNEPVSVADEPVRADATVQSNAGASRSATASNSYGDLADIAARLAQLEQELDGLRPRSKRSTETDEDAATGS